VVANPKKDNEEEEFWHAVVLCLREFHSFDEKTADSSVWDVRARLSKRSIRTQEAVYHNEPFNLACDIAGKQLPATEFMEPYTKILQSAGLA
jgi:hypothetical protein